MASVLIPFSLRDLKGSSSHKLPTHPPKKKEGELKSGPLAFVLLLKQHNIYNDWILFGVGLPLSFSSDNWQKQIERIHFSDLVQSPPSSRCSHLFWQGLSARFSYPIANGLP